MWSKSYLKAIAQLTQAFYESGFFLTFSGTVNWSDPWAQFCNHEILAELAKKVEEENNYELSWNQCCNAISWVYKLSPSEWMPYLEEKDES